MAKKIKKVTVSKWDEVAKERFVDMTTPQAVKWHDTEIMVLNTIPLADVMSFVSVCTTNCFDDDGEFHPELLDFMLKASVLCRYANFNLPENTDHLYTLVYATDAYDTVMPHINMDQYNAIESAVYKKVKHICEQQEIGLRKQYGKAVELLSDMAEQMSQAFKGVTSEDIGNMVSSISGGVDEEKIVHAYLNSDKAKVNEDNVTQFK